MLRFAGCALPGDGVAGSTVVGWITNAGRAVPIGGRRGGEGAESEGYGILHRIGPIRQAESIQVDEGGPGGGLWAEYRRGETPWRYQ